MYDFNGKKVALRPPGWGEHAILADVDDALKRLDEHPHIILGSFELVEILQMKHGTMWARRWHGKYYPPVFVELACGPIYLKQTVRQWIEEQRLIENAKAGP